MVPLISAIGAVTSQLELAAPTATAAPASAGSFGDMVLKAANEAVGTMQKGEAAAIEGVKGDMPTFKVVDAVMSAQRTLQQTIAIRDKAVSAYQDITRMSI